jgi:hypothetical protein
VLDSDTPSAAVELGVLLAATHTAAADALGLGPAGWS